MPIDPAEVMKFADLIMRTREPWASLPSDDLQIRTTVEALCQAIDHALDRALAPILATLAVLTAPTPDEEPLREPRADDDGE